MSQRTVTAVIVLLIVIIVWSGPLAISQRSPGVELIGPSTRTYYIYYGGPEDENRSYTLVSYYEFINWDDETEVLFNLQPSTNTYEKGDISDGSGWLFHLFVMDKDRHLIADLGVVVNDTRLGYLSLDVGESYFLKVQAQVPPRLTKGVEYRWTLNITSIKRPAVSGGGGGTSTLSSYTFVHLIVKATSDYFVKGAVFTQDKGLAVGADITLKNLRTGTILRGVSNASGIFEFNLHLAGDFADGDTLLLTAKWGDQRGENKSVVSLNTVSDPETFLTSPPGSTCNIYMHAPEAPVEPSAYILAVIFGAVALVFIFLYFRVKSGLEGLPVGPRPEGTPPEGTVKRKGEEDRKKEEPVELSPEWT